ncbi:19867_t:CDS:2, partial [Gigaspora rosea]
MILYTVIIDAENIKDQKTSLFKKVKDLDEWKKLNEINLPKKELPFNQQAIKVWFEENENEIEENCKQLVQDIRHIWNFLSVGIKPKVFQQRNIEFEFGDVIGYIIGNNKTLFEVLFVE